MPSVLLLGASSDIAAALARKFASAGHDIQLAARNVHRLEPLRADLSIRYGIRTTLLEFDARSFDRHTAFWAGLTDKPDITICVFGFLGDQTVAESDWAECRNILEVNYVGAVSILNIVANEYIALGKGAIVGISSVAGERGRKSNYLYGSAKAGFTAYLSGLRNRLFHHGRHVLTVNPGFVDTRMTEGLPLPPLLTATPEQVASAVFKAVEKKKNIIYVKWFWRWIMLIIKTIPESLFKKLDL
ncbi:MAG TPA: SDR family oxidoreductase [Puia sp.]|jgi:decaprenylphospho-beta-D-erythro-pentofuranosid-2-ulose 2-reductase|nr:SDR family oxidoreductase [Puia sp.]